MADADEREVAKLEAEPRPTPTEPESGQEMEENLVSKHPEATIPESDVSLADIERSRAHPVRWALGCILALAALVFPYWAGRTLAVQHTAQIVRRFANVDPRGIALVAWAVTLFAFVSLAMMIVDRRKIPWFISFVVFLCGEQFVSGVSLLKFDFWHSTYVMYGDSARIANAANLGIIAASLALAVFAVVWVGLLVVVKKDSPLSVLTHVWTSMLLWFVLEVVALLIVMFGGMLTIV